MTAHIRGPVVGCALFALYALTSARTVGWEDSSFFQLCHAVLGVPHGPGFPLYVLMGRVWSLSFGQAVAWAGNLFSALAMAASGVLILELILALAARVGRAAGTSRPDAWSVAAAMGVVLGWGTLHAVWQQAVRTEVYPLTLCCLLLSALCMVRSRDLSPHGSIERAQAARYVLAGAWCWGLAMAIHPLIAVAAGIPWLLYGLWPWRRRPIVSLMLVLCALAPMSLYLFPLIRGRIPGAWVWGSFADLSSTLDYFLRRTAWAAVQAKDGGWVENLRGWWHALPALWPVGLWLPALVALYWLRTQRALWGAIAATVVLVLWAAPYNPLNLDLIGYFLPCLAMLAVAVGVFVVRAVAYVRARMPGIGARSRVAFGFVSIGLVLGWPTAGVIASRHSFGLSHGAGELVRALALSLPRNAVVIASGDNLLGALTYAQTVEKVRPDLIVVASGALRHPFYRARTVAALPPALRPDWDVEQLWDVDTWTRHVGSWLTTLPPSTRLFSPYDNIPGLQATHLTPAGYLYAWVDPPAEPVWSHALSFWQSAPYAYLSDPVAREQLAQWTFNFGSFALKRGQDDIGWEAFLAALDLMPEQPEMYYLLGQALAGSGRVDDARAMFSAAANLAPYRARYRKALSNLPGPLAVAP